MCAYFIRRLLLLIPTLFGVTLIVFIITRFVPGGPLEQALMEAQAVDSASGFAASTGDQPLSEEQLALLKSYYGFDQPWYSAYFQWLGKIFVGDLSESYRWNEPVTSLMADRLPISVYYGLITFFLTYAICIPLGIVKAIAHRTVIDNTTSILIFAGYAVPGYALGALLILFFSVQLDWFPLGGFVNYQYSHLLPWRVFSDWEAFLSVVHHSVLPLACYLVGSFAVTTLLMKNHLMDNLASDYMRTAVAKGASFKRAVFKHALRNSLIPIATTFGQNLVLFVSGSFLIEFLFDIDGFGLLGFEAVIQRDYFVVMGVVLVSSLLLLIGNILSDLLVALIDPRVRFQ
ncbi:MAG: ABC transporter permease [Puniceicoccaceae bacterium]